MAEASVDTAPQNMDPAASPAEKAEAGANGKRLRRPVKPDKEAHRAAVDGLQDELNKRRIRSDNLRQMIEQKKTSGGSPETVKAKTKLNELSASFRAEVESKNVMREELKALNGARDALRAQLREIKSKLGPYVTVQKIDERLQALEHRLSHTTVDLKDENKAREEMKKTAALKPLAAQHVTNQEKLKASDKQRESLLGQMKAADDKITQIKAEEEVHREALSELRKKDAAKTQDVPSLIKERDECREVMNALYQKIKELHVDFKQKNNEFWQESQAFREQMKEERREKDAQREKEYQERQAERQAAAREFAGEPYHKEIALCDQLLSHLAKYTQPAQPSGPSTTATVKENNANDNAFKGMKAVPKTKKVDDEFEAMLGSASKKGKGKKAKAEKENKPTAQKLNHSLDMIEAFSKLKVNVPTSTGQIPSALEEVEQSKKYWLKKREEAKEKGELPVPEPSTSVPNGVPKGPKASTKKQATYSITDDFPDIAGSKTEADNIQKAKMDAARTKFVTLELSYVVGKVRVRLEPDEDEDYL